MKLISVLNFLSKVEWFPFREQVMYQLGIQLFCLAILLIFMPSILAEIRLVIKLRHFSQRKGQEG